MYLYLIGTAVSNFHREATSVHEQEWYKVLNKDVVHICAPTELRRPVQKNFISGLIEFGIGYAKKQLSPDVNHAVWWSADVKGGNWADFNEMVNSRKEDDP